jgi:serine/threonine protein kinase/tetratricopeptide (TPR) repeat protein
MGNPADKNLLFGVMALQLEFISRDALVGAMHAWVLEKWKSIGEILVAQKALTEQRCELLETLVKEHLRQNDGDARRSLASLCSPESVHVELSRLADAEVQASVAHLPIENAAEQARSLLQKTIPISMLQAAASTRFKFLRPWREGGLGKVSIARDEELHREVALKEIKTQHAHSKNSRDRFLIEGEITGSLEHPGIVPVYGMGKYADGRPYYAMRFVRGESLEEAIERFHCTLAEISSNGRRRVPRGDAGQRSVAFRELLNRFNDVCNAVAYAHSRGVLHRDIKPANIILGKYGETLVVDWGLAKAQGKKDKVLLTSDEAPLEIQSGNGSGPTRMGALIGTPAYMSPEQSEGRLDLLGPASDVYSLGATLYVLLTGVAPFTDGDVETVLRKVRNSQFVHPRQINRQIGPALDAICLKAMSRSAGDRYHTPTDLANDIEHWLADEPVSAFRDPIWQRMARWARHHRGLTQTTVLGLIIITIASLVATALIGKAQQVAVRESHKSQRVVQLLEKLFQGSDPLGLFGTGGLRFENGNEHASKMTARELLDRAVDGLHNIPEELEVQARLLDVIGAVYIDLGDFHKASEILREAVEMRSKQMSATTDTSELLTAMHNLAYALHFGGKMEEAEQIYRDTLARRQKLLGVQNVDVATTMFLLGTLLGQQQKYPEAEDLMLQSINICTRLEGTGGPSVALANAGMVALKLEQNDFDGASPYLIEAASNLKGTKPGVIVGDYQRALQLMGQGNTRDAVPLMKKTLDLITSLLGPRHPYVAWVAGDYGKCLMEDGQSAAAEKALRDALEISMRSVGPKHEKLRTLRVMLAQLYYDTGRSDEAESVLREDLRAVEESSGPQSDAYADALGNIATLQAETDLEKAKETLREALKIAQLRGYSPTTAGLVIHYARLLDRDSDQHTAAQSYLAEELASARNPDAKSFAVGLLSRDLGRIYFRQKRYDLAENLLRESCEVLADSSYGGREHLARAKALLGGTLLAEAKLDEAQSNLVLAWGWFKAQGKTGWAKDSLQWLLELREKQNQDDEALPLRQQLEHWDDQSRTATANAETN